MKNLYARMVLWLIRPAVQQALAEAALDERIDALAGAASESLSVIRRELRAREAAEAAMSSKIC